MRAHFIAALIFFLCSGHHAFAFGDDVRLSVEYSRDHHNSFSFNPRSGQLQSSGRLRTDMVLGEVQTSLVPPDVIGTRSMNGQLVFGGGYGEGSGSYRLILVDQDGARFSGEREHKRATAYVDLRILTSDLGGATIQAGAGLRYDYLRTDARLNGTVDDYEFRAHRVGFPVSMTTIAPFGDQVRGFAGIRAAGFFDMGERTDFQNDLENTQRTRTSDESTLSLEAGFDFGLVFEPIYNKLDILMKVGVTVSPSTIDDVTNFGADGTLTNTNFTSQINNTFQLRYKL